MSTTKAGPFYEAFEGSKDGVIKQELITYKIKDGMLVIEKTQRSYSGDDYQDTVSSTPLAEVK
jgi:hypothetical protein